MSTATWRHRVTTLATLLAAALPLLPATASAAEPAEQTAEFDHSQAIVVGPTEQPFSAQSTGSTDGDAIVFNGRGSYHSVGMSQYGARGQALAGRSASQITATYYEGTSLEARTPGFPIRVAVVHDSPRIRVVPRDGRMDVRFADRARITAPGGKPWTVTIDSRGRCTTTGPDGPVNTGGCPTFDPTTRIDVQQPSGSGWSLYGTYGSDAYASGAVVDIMADRLSSGGWRLDTVVQLPLEQYLYGLAEVPYSWEPAALRAQAIAGRSYAMHRMISRGRSPDAGCSCHVWDSQRDQVYRGHEREVGARWDDWKAAVDGTRDKVVVARRGQAGYDETAQGVVQAFYSASSHGRTENKHEVFYPSTWAYMVTVDDDWSLEAPSNPYASWSRSFTRADVANRVGLPSISSVEVTQRRESGSAKTVVFRGGGRTVTLSGDEVRWKFGLLSNGFGIGDEAWADQSLPPPSDLFDDDDGNVHEGSIDWLANSGITKGCNPPSNTRYCPDDPVTRAQMATFLTRALDLPDGQTGTFSDVASGSTHERSIAALAKAGITVGCNPPGNTRFCPNDPVTRAQMATFLFRALG